MPARPTRARSTPSSTSMSVASLAHTPVVTCWPAEMRSTLNGPFSPSAIARLTASSTPITAVLPSFIRANTRALMAA